MLSARVFVCVSLFFSGCRGTTEPRTAEPPADANFGDSVTPTTTEDSRSSTAEEGNSDASSSDLASASSGALADALVGGLINEAQAQALSSEHHPTDEELAILAAYFAFMIDAHANQRMRPEFFEQNLHVEAARLVDRWPSLARSLRPAQPTALIRSSADFQCAESCVVHPEIFVPFFSEFLKAVVQNFLLPAALTKASEIIELWLTLATTSVGRPRDASFADYVILVANALGATAAAAGLITLNPFFTPIVAAATIATVAALGVKAADRAITLHTQCQQYKVLNCGNPPEGDAGASPDAQLCGATTCDTPPSSQCNVASFYGNTVIQTFGNGRCVNNTCVYSIVGEERCPDGSICSGAGNTIHCASLCARVVCNSPPPSQCNVSGPHGPTVIQHFGNGQCLYGRCEYRLVSEIPCGAGAICVGGGMSIRCQPL